MTPIALARVEAYRIPLCVPIRGLSHREGFLLHVVGADGVTGTGDACPWQPAPGLRAELVAAARELAGGALEASARDASPLPAPFFALPRSDLWNALSAEARWCVELALADLEARRAGLPLWRVLTAADATPEVEVHALVDNLASARAAVAEGYTTLKVKLSATSSSSTTQGGLGLLRAVRAELPASLALRADCNGAPVDTAALAALNLELVEEPGAAGGPPRFADESLRELLIEATTETLRAPNADLAAAHVEVARALSRLPAGTAGIVVKPAFTGLHAALRTARAAHARGLAVLVTHALDSAVGRAGAAHVALALNAEGIGVRAHGLSHTTTPGVDVAEPLAITRARITASAPGLGVAPTRRADALSARPGPTDLPHPVAAAARARPGHPALVLGEQTVTWSALRSRVASLAGALHAAGVRTGDRVAVPLARCQGSLLDAAERIHAATWLGAIATPGDAGDADAVVGALPPGPELPERDSAADADRYLVHTSGTTGAPSAVRLGALQATLSAFGSAMRLGHALDDVWGLCLPLDRVGGLMILERAAWGATTARLLGARFDADAVAEQLVTGQLSLLSLVPAQLERVVAALGERPVAPSVRAILVGGAPAAPELLARARHLPIVLTWGMTETASQVATEPPGAPHGAPVAPLAFARLGLIPGPRGTQLTVEGPIARGRLVTRDVGILDPHGAVTISGRADDTIISGGVNLDPAAIEAGLSACPGIGEVLVTGLADPEWGERPHALYTGTALPEEVLAFSRAHLPRLQQPDTATHTPRLPVDALGKTSRIRARTVITGGSL